MDGVDIVIRFIFGRGRRGGDYIPPDVINIHPPKTFIPKKHSNHPSFVICI